VAKPQPPAREEMADRSRVRHLAYVVQMSVLDYGLWVPKIHFEVSAFAFHAEGCELKRETP
jgi:hypothetical protein